MSTINRFARMVKYIGLAGIILFGFVAESSAVEPPLKDRAFFRDSVVPTVKQPWVNLQSLEVSSNKAAQNLKKWLIKYEPSIATWPPKYKDKAGATRLIKDWQKKKSFVKKEKSALLSSPESASLVVTFWAYGHNLDEPNAATRAYSAIDQMQKNFSDSPIPPLLRGMLLNATGGKEATKHLAEAKQKTTDKKIWGMSDLTLTSRCMTSGRSNRAVMAFSRAMDECASCVSNYEWILQQLPPLFFGRPDVKNDKPYYLARAKDAIVVASGFFGYYLQVPKSWGEPRLSPYDPSRPTSVISLNGPPLPGIGIQHGLTVFSEVSPQLADSDAVPKTVKLLSGRKNVESFAKIKSLTSNKYLKKWYRIDTRQRVGKNDYISLIVASGIIKPVKWTREQHAKLSSEEPVCESGPYQQGELGKTAYWRKSVGPRIDAPVEISVVYAGSRNTFKLAEKQMKKIISKLEISEHSGSEFFNN